MNTEKGKDNILPLTIVSCNDAVKTTINFPSSSKLSKLKEAISLSDTLSRCPIEYQRLFFYGRELKTGGRSLSSLGLERFKPYHVLQLYSTEPKTKFKERINNKKNKTTIQSKEEEETTKRVRRSKRTRSNSSTSSNNNNNTNNNDNRKSARTTTRNNHQSTVESVIEIGDSDKEEEEEHGKGRIRNGRSSQSTDVIELI